MFVGLGAGLLAVIIGIVWFRVGSGDQANRRVRVALHQRLHDERPSESLGRFFAR
jgi:hypothetical protein